MALMIACGCVLALPAAAQASNVKVQVVLTDPNLTRAALTQQSSEQFSSRRLPRGLRVLDVDDHIRYQSIVGFGAAMTDSSAWLIHNYLDPGTRKHVLDQLFSSAAGDLDLDLVRVPVGGSDFTSGGTPYTYDDLPAGQTDPNLQQFNLNHDRSYVIPTLQQMMKVNPAIDVMSAEWTAPAWMKTNDSTGNVSRAGNLLTNDYPVLAQYLVKFIQAYAAAGIPIWAITPQNEPGAPVSYPSMNLTPAQEARFIAQYLAPAFAAAGIQTRIYGGDIGAASPSYATAVQDDAGAASAVSGEAWHCYGGQQGITAFHNAFKSVQELMTECSPGIIPYSGAEAAIDAIRNWSSAASLWNVALDPSGGPVQPPDQGCHSCSGLLTINESTHKVSYNLNYYQLGQLSEFVQRGAVRIDTQRWVGDIKDGLGYRVSPGLDNVAFLNPDGSRVLVAYNHSSASITFGVSWHHRQFSYTLPAGATVTFRWNGNGAGQATVSTDSCFNSGVSYARSGSEIVAEPACR